MTRFSLTLRALVLVPLLAVGVDLARATLACGPRAESCLEAAGRGWLGPVGIALVLLYAAALSVGVARVARGMAPRPGAPPSVARLWGVGSAGVAAVCGGQALIAGALNGPSLGGGWPTLIALCLLAGGVVALVLRAAPAAAAALRALRPAAPRIHVVAPPTLPAPAPPRRRLPAPLAQAAAGRAPPLTTG